MRPRTRWHAARSSVRCASYSRVRSRREMRPLPSSRASASIDFTMAAVSPGGLRACAPLRMDTWSTASRSCPFVPLPRETDPRVTLPSVWISTDGRHDACAFVTGDERQRRLDRPIAVCGMQVGVAAAARKDLDEDLAGGRCRNRDLLDGEWLAKGADHGRLHRLGHGDLLRRSLRRLVAESCALLREPPAPCLSYAPHTAARCRVACSDKTTPPRRASTIAW